MSKPFGLGLITWRFVESETRTVLVMAQPKRTINSYWRCAAKRKWLNNDFLFLSVIRNVSFATILFGLYLRVIPMSS